MMNFGHSWMGAGMWFYTTAIVLVAVLAIVAIIKAAKK